MSLIPGPQAPPSDGDVHFDLLLDEAIIQKRVTQLGTRIRQDYGDVDLTLICVLTGSLVFAADLCRAIPGELRLETISARSYGDGQVSSGSVSITHASLDDLSGRHVLLVEDIVDTGLTAQALLEHLSHRGASSLRLATLLFKPGMGSPIAPDYVGFEVGEEFVVGYGLDWAGKYRNLPFVARVRQSSAAKHP